MNTSSNQKPLIDPRGPRFGAAITSVLLVVTVGLGLIQGQGSPTLPERLLEPAFVVLAILTGLFAWGAFAGIQRHPYGLIFRALIRPRLSAPEFLEEPQPPTFAQLVGFLVAATGIILHLANVPFGLVIAASAAFIASFLNAVFGLCLGCEMYGLLVRAKVIRPAGRSI
jgi:hypothetical protein